jgi:nucleotide-binding universal stress UspA family protein
MGHWNALLCGVDFSEPSRHAMLEACHLAKQSNARLTLVHVFEPPVSGYAPTELVEPPSPKLLGVVTEELERKLETWRAEAARITGGDVAGRVLPGVPGEEIPRLAREEGFDLVVVATHGRHGVKRLLMGSVAERIVREAPCSVLVARRAARGVASD